MIHVKKDYRNPPIELEHITIKNLVKLTFQTKKAESITGNHYNRKGEVKRKLMEIYNEKCAYCESKVEHCVSLQVEHYRPKNKVVDPITPSDGYYWLVCEWSNLLLACPKCNGKGAKGNKFPIRGVRITDHTIFLTNNELDHDKCSPEKSPLADERPLLLNPEINIPDLHFQYDFCGQVSSNTDEGVATIQVCKLDRPKLTRFRKKKIDRVIESLHNALAGVVLNGVDDNLKYRFKKIFDQMKMAIHPSREYTLLRKEMFHRFIDLIIPAVDDKFKNMVINAFNKYNAGTL